MLIGAFSIRTDCHVETIRYYERIGLLPKPPRTEGGHRLYDREQVKRLIFIRRTRELGFSLDEVRALGPVNKYPSQSRARIWPRFGRDD